MQTVYSVTLWHKSVGGQLEGIESVDKHVSLLLDTMRAYGADERYDDAIEARTEWDAAEAVRRRCCSYLNLLTEQHDQRKADLVRLEKEKELAAHEMQWEVAKLKKGEIEGMAESLRELEDSITRLRSITYEQVRRCCIVLVQAAACAGRADECSPITRCTARRCDSTFT